MTTKDNPRIPVDDRTLEEVPDAYWTQDDTPARHFERIANNPDAQAALNSALAQIREHQATLAQVRKAKQLTQTTIGELLEMDQSEVSRLERRSDMLLSTLRCFIQAAGGELQLVATFPESAPVQLLVGDKT